MSSYSVVVVHSCNTISSKDCKHKVSGALGSEEEIPQQSLIVSVSLYSNTPITSKRTAHSQLIYWYGGYYLREQ